MRLLGTELNMLARLGFPKNKNNLETFSNHASSEHAYEALVDGDFAHVLYAVTYRGKRCRNKTPLHVELSPKSIECFTDDASFFKRTNELYEKGVYWIGAFHNGK